MGGRSRARARVLDALVYSLVLCSPAIMLGVARANIDLVLFTLVVAGVLLLRRAGRAASVRAHALILLAAFLKLFPIFASVTPQVNGYSYGVRLLGWWLSTGNTGLSAHSWDLLLLAIAAAAALLAARFLRPPGAIAPWPLREVVRDGDAFVAGAAIYVCTYALFRSYDYRLAFLLLTVPQLLRWVRQRHTAAVMTLAALLATVWLSTPWGGDPRLYYTIIDVQTWISKHTRFHQPLPLEAFPQLVLAAGLAAVLLAGATRLAVVRWAREAIGSSARASLAKTH